MLESELLHGKLSRADHFVVVSAQLYNNSYISCIDHGHDFKSYCHIRVQDIIAIVHECYEWWMMNVVWCDVTRHASIHNCKICQKSNHINFWILYDEHLTYKPSISVLLKKLSLIKMECWHQQRGNYERLHAIKSNDM